MSNKILIVDDEPHIRLLLEQTLEELEVSGVELILAANGEEALELIRTERPQIVFLDVMMPRLNGFDVCQQVKQDPELQQTIIVMLTAKGQEFDKQRGQEVGADLYITKPFDPDRLMVKAAELLGLGR
ncbi:MAG: response regulator [Thermostichus sp. DG02_5_bins_236]